MSQEPVQILEAQPYFVPQSQETTRYLLQELKRLVSSELHNCLQKVAEDYQQNPNIPDHNLNNLLKTMIKEKAKETSLFTRFYPWPSIKKPKVYPVVTGTTFGAHEKILKLINVEECQNLADCEVVVVFCPVSSRVGSDVHDTMKNIAEKAKGKKMILVVMHHSREDVSLTPIQLIPEHQNVKDIQVLYHESKNGLIECDRNDKAIQELKELCKTKTTT